MASSAENLILFFLTIYFLTAIVNKTAKKREVETQNALNFPHNLLDSQTNETFIKPR